MDWLAAVATPLGPAQDTPCRNTPRLEYAGPALFQGPILPVPFGTHFGLLQIVISGWHDGFPQRRRLTHQVATCSRSRLNFGGGIFELPALLSGLGLEQRNDRAHEGDPGHRHY